MTAANRRDEFQRWAQLQGGPQTTMLTGAEASLGSRVRLGAVCRLDLVRKKAPLVAQKTVALCAIDFPRLSGRASIQPRGVSERFLPGPATSFARRQSKICCASGFQA